MGGESGPVQKTHLSVSGKLVGKVEVIERYKSTRVGGHDKGDRRSSGIEKK